MEIENEWLAMNPDRLTVTKLNPIGALVLEELKNQKSIEQIVGKIVTQYDVAEDQALKDVLIFLNTLQEAGLVSHVEF